MNYPMAIVIASALIAGAMFFSNQNDLGAAGSGTYAGVGVDGYTAWVVDTTTGLTKYCELTTDTQRIWCSWEQR